MGDCRNDNKLFWKQELKTNNSYDHENDKHLNTSDSIISIAPSVKDTSIIVDDTNNTENIGFSAEIEAITEKLHYLNNVVKMNKDLDVLAKENLIRNDVLKKLTLKEKWLNNNNVVDAGIIDFNASASNLTDQSKNIDKNTTISNNRYAPKSKFNDNLTKVKNTKFDLNENILNIDDKTKQLKTKISIYPSLNQEAKIETKNNETPKQSISTNNIKFKEIDINNISSTMKSIKPQLDEPTINAPTSNTFDISKYFPNQKEKKDCTSKVNKNQKNLKDIDLTKYFPNSSAPSRRSSTVITVADKLKFAQNNDNNSKLFQDNNNNNLSLQKHQLDGAVDDFIIKKNRSKVVSPLLTDTKNGKKKKIRIVKKKVYKDKNLCNSIEQNGRNKMNKKSHMKKEEAFDMFLDEILLLNHNDEHNRSPSFEYKRLFQEERSPSDDISDKFDYILKSQGIDLNTTHTKNGNCIETISNKSLEIKSLEDPGTLSEGEVILPMTSTDKSKDDKYSFNNVQNILKHFESMDSLKSTIKNIDICSIETTGTTQLMNKPGELKIVCNETKDDIDQNNAELSSRTQEHTKTQLSPAENDKNAKKIKRKRDKTPLQERGKEQLSKTNYISSLEELVLANLSEKIPNPTKKISQTLVENIISLEEKTTNSEFHPDSNDNKTEDKDNRNKYNNVVLSSNEDNVKILSSHFPTSQNVNVATDSSDKFVNNCLSVETKKATILNDNTIIQNKRENLSKETTSFPILSSEYKNTCRSSSNDYLDQLAPQNYRKKINQLLPIDMPPSIQDILGKLISTDNIIADDTNKIMERKDFEEKANISKFPLLMCNDNDKLLVNNYKSQSERNTMTEFDPLPISPILKRKLSCREDIIANVYDNKDELNNQKEKYLQDNSEGKEHQKPLNFNSKDYMNDVSDLNKNNVGTEYANVPQTGIQAKRLWPDGKTIFQDAGHQSSSLKLKPKLDIYDKKYSDSPSYPDNIKYSSSPKGTTPETIYEITQIKNYNQDCFNKSHQSSIESDHQPKYIFDEKTRRLLDRSKRLHDRKCNFVNDRVIERNPYMRDVINQERNNNHRFQSYQNDDSSDEIENYRYKKKQFINSPYIINNRFPISCSIFPKKQHLESSFLYVGGSTYLNKAYQKNKSQSKLS